MTYRLPWHRRIFKQPWFVNVMTWLLAFILTLLRFTFRVEKKIHPDAKPYADGEFNAIFCFWHGRMIVLPFFIPKNRSMHVLISHHRDGELIAKLIKRFGIDSVRGSSSKGAKEATRELERLLQEDENIAITPDGPRGPARVAAKGAAFMAKRSGKPLIPVSFSAARAKRMSSWDAFMIPLPFTRIVLEVGAPIMHHDAHDTRAVLENELNRLCDQADAAVEG